MNSGVVPLLISTGFLSAGGVAALIGLWQKGRQDRVVNNATLVAEVVDGLKVIAAERADDAKQRAEDLKAEREASKVKDQRIAELEAQLQQARKNAARRPR